ncbi:hypothetical protein Rhopal_001140-T1 [Rhodotorula paludigena]|uniref:Uncharacterized protein n=1 Tax=Rhodotorula paludigena TaxID=86838 RepID=A0AAV5G6T4_9BASI|nr:hypothetical protein Rhopal_001140-T1 [Rhodotorula paludigena]
MSAATPHIPVAPSPSQSSISNDDKHSMHDDKNLHESTAPQGAFDKSMGVARIEAINSQMGPYSRAWLFSSIFLVAYAYSLDATVRGTLQSYATNSFDNHSLLATVNVLKSIIAAAAYPPYSKLADYFGRVEMIGFSIVMYVVGTIVEACAKNMETFCAGWFVFGYSAAILLVEIIISDLTSLRSRLLFSAGANVTDAVVANMTWQAGIGIWAAVYPVCCFLLAIPLVLAHIRAKRAGLLDKYASPYKQLGFKGLLSNIFWEIDLVGAILMIAVLALILLPFTLAGGVDSKWGEAHNIAMLVIGVVVALPAFIVWELKFARVPCFPFHLMKTRTVLGCLGIAFWLNCCWYMQGDYLYTVLVVGFHQSVLSATRITSMYSFSSVITGILAGFFVRYVLRRLKPIILAGVAIFLIAFGLLIRYRGGENSYAGVTAAQVVLGIAGGLFPYSAQALIQTEGSHQHTSILLASYLATYNIGSSFGNSISGAIWTQLMPGKIEEYIGNNATAVQAWYGSPLTAILTPEGQWGEPQRMGVVLAYQHVQKILCIVGICFGVLLAGCALIVRDPILGAEQSLPGAESGHQEAKSGKADQQA